jgi:lysophospholipase L1-like esterase
MRMVVLGDSVVWGQGLLLAEKFSSQIYAGLGGQAQDDHNFAVLAHSGATIGARAQGTGPSLDGEVPDSYPTIFQQCASFDDDPDTVDVVIVNGGINDVGAFNIVNPLTDSSDLQEKTDQYCYRDMLALLQAVLAKFPNPATRIAVPSYYPILSDESDRVKLPHFLGVHGVELSRLLTDLGEVVFRKIFAQCSLFADRSSTNLRQAVADANTQLGGGRVRFAQVPFTPSNSALAGNAWLWGIELGADDLELSPEDPMSQARHLACDHDETDPLRLPTCYLASAGHPNIIGAQQFAAAMLDALA